MAKKGFDEYQKKTDTRRIRTHNLEVGKAVIFSERS